MDFVKFGSNSPDVDDSPAMNFSPSIPLSPGQNNSDDAALVESSQLVEQGNVCFRSRRFEEAIDRYSRALILNPTHLFVVLSNRSAAFCGLSMRLLSIPAAQSEKSALYGFDPISLAELALKDAEKLLKVAPHWPKGFLRKAVSLTLLEKYHEAREAYLEGLQIDPLNEVLRAGLKQLSAELELTTASQLQPATSAQPPGQLESTPRASLPPSEEFDCSLCLKLLFCPVTTPCGHSFCRACLVRALDHRNKCPVCRTVLFVSPRSYPVSVTLQTILERHFAEEYGERRKEEEATAVSGREILPLFVMDVVLPGQKMALNIFEPRYRLMVRRCMEGNHKMGMVGINADTRLPADVACEVEIKECEALPDGRFYLEVQGQRRCRIVRSWEQDGYRVGQTEWLQDNSVSMGSSEASQLDEVAESAAELARTWVTRVNEANQNSRRGRVSEVIRQAGPMPPVSQPEELSFWLARMLPMRTEEKLLIMRMTNTADRLRLEMEYLRADHSLGCRLQ